VCGEETALLNAIEGRRGEVRLRPPYPAVEGLHGRPTVVNNVETLANVPWIVERGGEAYAALGSAGSRGTKALCLGRGFERPGLVEIEFGTPLRRVVEELGGGGRGGRPIEALLLGGPMGSVLLPDQWDVPVCYAAMAERGVRLGHGGLIPLLEGFDARGLFLHWLGFMASESCGKCVPCSLGTRRCLELAREPGAPDRAALERVLGTMERASLCGFGKLTPGPVRELAAAFGERIFGARGRA
jgi:NADH-quinone oxidoreductase subunit F